MLGPMEISQTKLTSYIELNPILAIPKDSAVREYCYLCGKAKSQILADQPASSKQSAFDREHVIPKVIFRPSEPTRPVILWSCRQCNITKERNDYYVTRFLQATSFLQPARRGIQGMLRGVRKGNDLKLFQNLRSNMHPVELKSPGGLYLGRGDALYGDLNRFETFYSTLAKGIWTRHTLRIRDWSKYSITASFGQVGDPLSTGQKL